MARDHTIPDEYLREIGRVAVDWSRIEASVETMIWAFLFVDQNENSPWWRETDGRAVTTHINFLLRLDVMLSLASQCPGLREFEFPAPENGHRWPLGPFNMTPFETLARWLRAAYTSRNRVVHGIWEAAGDRALRQTFRARGDVTPFYELVSAKQLSETADEIALLASNAADLAASLIRYLRAEVIWPNVPIFPSPVP